MRCSLFLGVAASIAALSACSGGASGTSSALPAGGSSLSSSNGDSSGGDAVAASHYTLTYIAADPGCEFVLSSGTPAEPPVLSPSGVIGANEWCGTAPDATTAMFIYDHGTRSHLPSAYDSIVSINSNKLALVGDPNGEYIYNLQTGTATPLQGNSPLAVDINDSGFSAGSVAPTCTPSYCNPTEPVRFASDGSYQVLAPGPAIASAINASGTVLVTPSGALNWQADLYEPAGEVTINTVIHQNSVEAVAINDNNHATILAGSNDSALLAYLFVGTSTPIPIPPVTGTFYVDPATVNDSDEVVGKSCATPTNCSVPFVFQPTSAGGNGKSVALTSIVPTLQPYPGYGSIENNNLGEIVLGAVQNGQVVIALLTPPGCNP